MRWFLTALVVIAGSVLIILLVGYLLPKQHTATRAARFHQSPEAVWSAITDYSKFPEWRKNVMRVEALPPVNGKPSWREFDEHGSAIPYEIVEWTPSQKLVVRIADSNLPFGGIWTYQLSPLPNGGTALRITENGEIYNPIFRFVARFFLGYTKTIEDYLRALASKLGENMSLEN
jgi:uncharacterized protein YndB with AHSA1/START domain